MIPGRFHPLNVTRTKQTIINNCMIERTFLLLDLRITMVFLEVTIVLLCNANYHCL